MKIDVSEVKRWTVLNLSVWLWRVVDISHTHKWRGSATYWYKVKNIQTWQVKEVAYKAWTTLDSADVTYKSWQYLYNAWDTYTFIEFDTSELHEISKDNVDDILLYLKENIDVYLMMYEENIIGIILPDIAKYKVTETTPWVKWDRAQAWTKPATLETWLEVQVPLFIEEWEEIELNTRTNEVKGRG